MFPDFCWWLVNTLLLVLCWIPPILRGWIKILLTLLYCGITLSWFVDWEECMGGFIATLERSNLLNATTIPICIATFGNLRQVGFLVTATWVLFGVAVEVIIRRGRTDPDEPDEFDA
jgi:hypothetical protein